MELARTEHGVTNQRQEFRCSLSVPQALIAQRRVRQATNLGLWEFESLWGYFASVVLTVSMTAFQADGEGSSPSRRSLCKERSFGDGNGFDAKRDSSRKTRVSAANRGSIPLISTALAAGVA